METGIKIINRQEVLGKNFTVYGTFENPLFLAKDVAEWIEHSDVSTMMRNIDENEKVTNIVCTLGGNQEAWFLTEDGLYEVLFQSRKPIAKSFKGEVKRILKELRTKGITATPATIDSIISDPAFGIKLLTELQNERAEKEALRLRTEEQTKQLKEAAPKVEYFDDVLSSKGLLTVNMIADCLGISAIKLNKLLCEWGIQYSQTGTYHLYSQYRDMGYAEHKPHPYTDSNGQIKTRQHMYWTETGKKFILDMYHKKIAA
jgi:phage antirepressor YoqD-like protein